MLLKKVAIHSPKITAPIRILHISDIQSGGIGDYGKRIFEKIKILKPDLIIHTGDLVQPIPPLTVKTEWPKLVALFEQLDPPGGIFEVIGDVDGWLPYYSKDKLGNLQLLESEAAVVTLGKQKLHLYGLPIHQSRGEGQCEKIIQQWHQSVPQDEFSILFGHSPDYIMKIKNQPIDLCLAGHTHGGQIRLPFLGPIVTLSNLPRSWSRGYREVGYTRMNVSAGLGCERAAGLPKIRFNCPSEMTLIELLPENL